MKKYISSAIMDLSEESLDAKVEIARDTADTEVLRKLSDDSEWWVRYWVAGNENTPADVLLDLASDRQWQVVQAVAGNRNTPTDALELLMESNVGNRIKELVAYHPNATPEMLEIYNRDIGSIKEEVTNYVEQELADVIDDFLKKLAEELPYRVNRYNEEWWNPDASMDPQDIIKREDNRGGYHDTLEDLIRDIIFGNCHED